MNYTGITLVIVQRNETGMQLAPIELEIEMEADGVFRPAPVTVGVGDRSRVSVCFRCQFEYANRWFDLVTAAAANARSATVTGPIFSGV